MSRSTDTSRSTARGAGAAGGTTLLATLIVWLLGYFRVTALSAEDGTIIAGVLSTVVLFVWHHGVLNILGQILHGNRPKPATTH